MTIWVVGNAVWDNQLPVSRFPVPGETVLTGRVSRSPGGKGANQAVILARFGCTVRFVTALGADPEGEYLMAELERHGLADISATQSLAPTDQSWIIVDPSGENMILSTHAAIDTLSPEQISAALHTAREGDFLVMQGNTSPAATLSALRAGHSAGLRTVFSPAPAWAEATEAWPFCDLVIFNQSEAQTLFGTHSAATATKMLIDAGAKAAVLTLGAHGVHYRDATGAAGQLPAMLVRVVDTAGAGDTLAAGVVAGLARGLDLPEALELALSAAAITVARTGTFEAFPTAQELQPLLACKASAQRATTKTKQRPSDATAKQRTV